MTVTVVTKENFLSLFPSIVHHIKEADFLAFDTELTGLTTGPSTKYFYYDNPNDRYRKLRDSATSFALLQFGLAAFKWRPSGRKYASTCYSFHLFPAAVSSSGTDYRRCLLQLSSILFLREHGFDFNKTFLDGIPFLSRKEEADLRAKQAVLKGADRAEVPLKEEDLLFIEDIAAIVQKWLDSRGNVNAPSPSGTLVNMTEGPLGGMKRSGKKNKATLSPESSPNDAIDDMLTLPPCNSFQRLILHQQLPRRFGGITLKKYTDENKETRMRITLTDETQRQAALEEELASFEANLTEQTGFRRLIEQIFIHQKPLVGHNCWLDLCHFYAKFIGPLPQEWSDLQTEWCKLTTGVLFDTKLLASDAIKRGLLTLSEGTSLEALATAADDKESWNGVKVPVEGGKTKNKAKQFHDAGYDAHCTGKVFIGLAALEAASLGGNFTCDQVIDSWLRRSLNPTVPANPHESCLFMMVSDWERGVNLLPGLNERPSPNRNHLIVITDLISATQPSQIVGFVTKTFGLPSDQFQLSWLDSRTVYLGITSAATEMIKTVTDKTLAVNGEFELQMGDATARIRLSPYETFKSRESMNYSPTSSKRSRYNNE